MPTKPRLANGAAAFIAASMTFIVYFQSLQNGFVNWDDDLYVYENKNIQIHGFNLSFIKWGLTAVVSSLWHPLTLFSLALDHVIWGLNPQGYHLTNTFFHALNTFLVFVLIVRLFSFVNVFEKKVTITGFVTALLFGIHPLHVESVAWISERKDVLSTFFFLLSIITYLKYATSKKSTSYFSSIILFVLALMSKPMAVSLPFVLIILDFYPLKRLVLKENYVLKAVLLEKAPFIIFSVFSSLITLWASKNALPPVEIMSLKIRFFVAVHAYIDYLLKMIFPFNLAPYYPHPLKINILATQYIGSFVIISVISFYCIRSIKKSAVLFPAWLYYVITLIPVIGIVQVGEQAAADRYTYLPSIGPFLLVGLGIGAIFERGSTGKYRIVVISVLAVMFMLLASMTIKQIGIWRNSMTLWSYEIRLFPDTAYKAYYNRGNEFARIGDYRKAINDFSRVIEISPRHSKAYNNRGNAYGILGDYERAIGDFTKAVENDPNNAEGYFNLGLAYSLTGRTEQATRKYRRAADLGLKEAQNALSAITSN